MSVIVKGMKMPTGCGSCDFAGFLPDEDPYCRRLMRTIRVVSKRLDDCPLGAIPPHGRLIDADALASKGADVRDTWIDSDGREDSVLGFSYDMIANVPTIIPAEEGEL